MSNPALKSLDDAFLNSLASAILNEAKPKTQTNPVRLSRLCEQLADEAGASLAALVPAIRCSVADIQSCRLSEFAASQALMSLNRFLAAGVSFSSTDAVVSKLEALRSALDVNRSLLKIHIDAVNEVSQIIVRCVQESQADGTYAQPRQSYGQF